MLVTISILLGIAFIFNIIEEEGDVNLLIASALVCSLWTICLPLAIITIVTVIICGIIYIYNN